MLHFAFGDGAVGYDCVACGARCCKGLGFALGSGELVPLLARAPRLAPFMQPMRGAVHVLDLEDGCWALADDGRCSIETEHGHAAKPSTCRLFPVNRLVRIDGVLIVDVQLSHCPLVDARTNPRTVIRWDEIARDLEAAGPAAMPMEGKAAPGAPDDWLAHEAAARDAAGSWEPEAAAWAAWRAFFDIDAAEVARLGEAVLPLYRLALPSLRMNLLTLPGAPPYPRLMQAIERQLAAGAWLACLSARAGRAPSLRGIAELWRGLPLMRELLARWDVRLTLANGVAPDSTPPEVAAAWATLQRRTAAATIGAALTETTLPAALRPLLLRLASDRMR
ncbi:MAG TPA: YkgJ family cysteine cluster protein [Polyangia bacterium]|nr:YkgJ family cysteine cluster protein [Polyangia bacterium]